MIKKVKDKVHPPTPVFTGCEECRSKDNEKVPSPGWASNKCITCLYNTDMPKTNNFEPISDGKTYA